MRQKDATTPRSFRLSPAAMEAIDEGSEMFNMNRTEWLEWLAISAVSSKKRYISTDRGRVIVESTKRT